MKEDFGFSLHRRGTHRLAGRTVLQLVSSLDAPDADQAAIDVAGALAEAGARPLVAAPAGNLVSELQAKGGIWVPFPTQAKNPLVMLLNGRRLRGLIASEQVDLVHARSRLAGWVAYGATRASHTPLVTSLHQLSPGQSVVKQRYNAVMAKGDVVLAGSRFAAATIASLYPLAAERIVLVRPGVDLRPYDPGAIAAGRVQALRHSWQVAPDERIILLAARPSVWKGHKVLIEAVGQLVEGGLRDVKLVLVGEGRGGAGRDVDHAVKAARLGDRIRRVGACADMPAALLAAAVVVVPSIEPEAFGRIVVEAQALGTPAVVSDLGAVPETILAPPDVEPAKRTGWRVSPSDPTLLADALRAALSLGASGRDALALRARKQAAERFAVERMARETLDAYAAVIERQTALT